MIRTLIFDLGGVIVPLDFERGFRQIADYSPHPPEELRRRLNASDLYLRAETGAIAPEAFYREISGLLELCAGEVLFRRIWCSIFLPHTLIDDQLIGWLHQRHRIVLLSNTNQIHFDWIRENYPILRHFDDFVLSYKVGHMKPAPEIYREAIRKAGCLPQECFFADDVAANVDGARNEGLDAVQFVDCRQLRADLAARGIAVSPPG
jgi:putative hydrolase of the HAD superfamily